jgi:tRNA(Ile)-lysidine synthase
MNLLSKFETSLQSFVSPKEKILIGCSAGPDSVALVHFFLALQSKWKFKLILCHYNHGLRGNDSNRDARFVRDLAKRFRIPVRTERGAVRKSAQKNKTSLEEAARELRYDFFIRTAKRLRIKKFALAHHLEDQAETILMRMLQGTGLRGLCGIRRVMKKQGVSFFRPLLGISKKEILDFLKINRIAFRKDLSNQSLDFLRNKIRLKLLPLLETEFNPKVVEALARIPAILNEENEVMVELEEKAWRETFKVQSRKVIGSRKKFMRLKPAIQFRLLERALKQIDAESGVSFDHWRTLASSLSRKCYCISLPKGVDLSLTPLKLIIYKKFRRAKTKG